MEENYYTLAKWRVKPDCEDEFLAAWDRLAEALCSLPSKPLRGTLVKCLTESDLYYFLGPWSNLRHIFEMRADKQVQEIFDRLDLLSLESNPRLYRVVRDLRPHSG